MKSNENVHILTLESLLPTYKKLVPFVYLGFCFTHKK